MKLGKLILQNVTSYQNRTEFTFDRRLNIFIGPNGGGKSNLQKTIAVILTHYFIHQWQVKNDEERHSLEQVQTYNKTQLRNLLGTYGDNNKEQVIELELIPEPHDIENIKSIGNNLERINKELSYYEKPYDRYEPLELISKITTADSFTYKILDRELIKPSDFSGEYGFLRYLNEFFVFMRVSKNIPELILSAPIFFFSSERALTKNFEIQAGHLTEDHYLSGFQSAFNAATGQTNLLQWGSQHFVRLYRRSLSKAGNERGAHYNDFLRSEPDVRLLDKYLEKLGYGWELHHDDEQTSFRLALIRGDIAFFSEIFSSGEREIVHFLIAMFALNARDGLILVDEPELHLHPRWQKIFLNLFCELAPERNNQFLIATHSPVFVSPETIQNVVRIYNPLNQGSHKVSLKEIDDLPTKKQLVRMINSQNNERMFFADKVVLVEGISDRIVLGSLVESALEYFKDNRSIEVIDVGSKYNFDGYRQLLGALKTPCMIIADRDYLEQVGSDAIKDYFCVDAKSQAKSLLDDKKSIDRKSLVSNLRQFVINGEKEPVLALLTYIAERHRVLKANLSQAQLEQIEKEYFNLSKKGIELLKYGGGEIEDYMPERLTDIGAIVELVSDKNWIVGILDEKTRTHLGEIISRIIVSAQPPTPLTFNVSHLCLPPFQPQGGNHVSRKQRQSYQETAVLA